MRQIKELYHALDVDGDGTLTPDEIKEGLERLGRDDSAIIYQILLEADEDGSGDVDFDEFLAALQGKNLFGKTVKPDAQVALINKLWPKYNIDPSGELDYNKSKSFIKEAMGNVPNKIFELAYNACDEDGSGDIGKEEMVDLMNMVRQNLET